jgi:hypothetical protein
MSFLCDYVSLILVLPVFQTSDGSRYEIYHYVPSV